MGAKEINNFYCWKLFMLPTELNSHIVFLQVLIVKVDLFHLQSTFFIYGQPFFCGSSVTFCTMYHNTYILGVDNLHQ